MNYLYNTIGYSGILDSIKPYDYTEKVVVTNPHKTLETKKKEVDFNKVVIHSNNFQDGFNLIEDYIKEINSSSYSNTNENKLKLNKNVTINTNVINRYRNLALQIKEEHNVLDKIDLVVFDPEKLKEVLFPGDIVFKYCSENSNGINGFNFITYSIRQGQSLAGMYASSATSISKNFTHPFIYLGEGVISESNSHGGVQNRLLSNERIQLVPGMTTAYLVIRPKNPSLANDLSLLVQPLAPTADGQNSYDYSIIKGFLGGISSSEFGIQGMKRYLKGAAYAHGHAPMIDLNGNRQFYCSYYVTWCLQVAESKQVIHEINEKLQENEKITFPDLGGLTISEAAKALEDWAFQTATKHYDLLNETINIKLDAKRTTPQRLYGFITEHPELFEHKMILMPPG